MPSLRTHTHSGSRSSLPAAVALGWRALAAGLAIVLPACVGSFAGPPRGDFAVQVVKPGVTLRGLAAPGSGVVWATGSRGTVLRSVDGGSTWRDVGPAAAAGSDLRSVVAWSSTCAVVASAGQPAVVLRTGDGGQSWVEVLRDPRPEAFFDAMAAHGDQVCLLGDPVAGGMALWRSADRGATWAAVPPTELPKPQAGEASFAAGNQCLELDAAGVRFVTGGTAARVVWLGPNGRWRAQPLPMVHGAPSQGAFAIASRGEQSVVVGGDYRDPAAAAGVAVVGRCGAGFVPSQGAGLGFRSAVRWLDDHTLLAVGEQGASWSGDGGRTFVPFGATGWHALAVAPEGCVHAAGAAGRLGQLLRR